ncbi:MAG: hypothetical protein WC516_04480 [Patescibacteria group bacterium]
MEKGTFVYDINLGELAKELREALATGRMRYDEALEVMKKAIKTSIAERQ